MNRKIVGIALILLCSAMLTTAISLVYAKPEKIEGQFFMVSGDLNRDPAGVSDIAVYEITGFATFFGDISGGANSNARWVASDFSGTPTPDSWVNMHIVFTLPSTTVIIDSQEYHGSLTLIFVGKMATGGNWVIISSNGGLAGLHGQGTFTPSSTPSIPPLIDYEGQVHFAP